MCSTQKLVEIYNKHHYHKKNYFQLPNTYRKIFNWNLEFHLWYLKAKRWVERLENGMLSITVEGIDHVNSEHQRKATTMLLMDRSHDVDDLD